MHRQKGKGRRQFLQSAAALAAAPLGAGTARAATAGCAFETNLAEGYGYENGNPYYFDSGPYLFTDWRYVVPGSIAYRSSAGEELPVKGSGSIDGIKAAAVQV